MGHNPVLVCNQRRNPESGQAIVMVVLALFAMCGVLGLAVDFGWAYFVKRAAQSAADSAAIAAAEEMRRMAGSTGPYPCLNGGTCRDDSAPYVCLGTVNNDTTDNLDNACLYARQNGFQEAGNQRVRISEGSDGAPPTLPGVTLQYWATIRVSESVPQLFAAITGNPIATVSARATAGIYEGQVRGSIILLNRNNDVASWGAGNPTGINLSVQGTSTVNAGGGILMASSCSGGCGSNGNAGELVGASSRVTAAFTSIRDTGCVVVGNLGCNPVSPKWTVQPKNGFAEGTEFQDPTRKKPQIPVNDSGLPDCGVIGGVLNSADSTSGTIELGPGNYYATEIIDGAQVPTGNPIQLRGTVNFRSGGSCTLGTSDPSAYSTHVIYGGIDATRATAITFESGSIVLAGARVTQNGTAQPLFNVEVGGSEFTMTGPGPGSAGNAFIFTDQTYDGTLNPPTTLSTWSQFSAGVFKQGTAGFKAGGNDNVAFTLDGLNRDTAGTFPPELEGYNGVVMWQDRRNSNTRYNLDGTYGCAAPYLNCNKTNQEAIDSGLATGSPEFTIKAGAQTIIRGVVYQPRGAWTTINGAPGMASPLQLISGAIRVLGDGTVDLQPVISGLPISIVSLVE